MKVISRPSQIVAMISFFLLLLWLGGVHVSDISRIIAAGAVLFLAFVSYRRYRDALCDEFTPPRAFDGFLKIFCVAYVALIPIYLVSKVYAGTHGIDFAIFSQVIENAWPRGKFQSSLISSEVVNFMGHHFVPIFIIPGLFGFLGVPGFVSGPIFHGAMVALGTCGIFRLCETLKLPRHLSLILTVLTLMNPSIRHTLFWGIHDETLAFGIIPWVYIFWLKDGHWWVFFLLVLTFMTKESMFLFGAMFCVMTLVCSYFGLGSKITTRPQLVPYVLLFFAALCGFVGYVFLQPQIWGKNFDFLHRLGSLEYLLKPGTLYEKGIWLGYLFLPVVFLPLWSFRTFLYLLPASPLIAMVLVSGFSGMHELNNYYSAIPSLIISIAAILSLNFYDWRSMKLLSPASMLLALSLAMSFASNKPSKDLIKNLTAKQYVGDDLQFIPDEAEVVVTPSSALFLLRCKKIYRLWIANQSSPDFDFIVTKHDEQSDVSQNLARHASVCKRTDKWVVWCKARDQG
jgi:uncharacterized membrane protein